MSTHISELYRVALRYRTYDEAIRYIITIDPMNWTLNGEAIRLNVKFFYEHIRNVKPEKDEHRVVDPHKNDLIGIFDQPF